MQRNLLIVLFVNVVIASAEEADEILFVSNGHQVHLPVFPVTRPPKRASHIYESSTIVLHTTTKPIQWAHNDRKFEPTEKPIRKPIAPTEPRDDLKSSSEYRWRSKNLQTMGKKKKKSKFGKGNESKKKPTWYDQDSYTDKEADKEADKEDDTDDWASLETKRKAADAVKLATEDGKKTWLDSDKLDQEENHKIEKLGGHHDWDNKKHDHGKKGEESKLAHKKEEHHEEKHRQKAQNTKEKDGGKDGNDWFKDHGKQAHGWKKVYHSESWGQKKKFHDNVDDKKFKQDVKKWEKVKNDQKAKKLKERKDKGGKDDYKYFKPEVPKWTYQKKKEPEYKEEDPCEHKSGSHRKEDQRPWEREGRGWERVKRKRHPEYEYYDE